jgi:hypothetical protein
MTHETLLAILNMTSVNRWEQAAAYRSRITRAAQLEEGTWTKTVWNDPKSSRNTVPSKRHCLGRLTLDSYQIFQAK